MTKPAVTAVIVTYKTKTLLRDCLNSLYNDTRESGPPTEVIVVDNASNDGTVEMIREEFPETRLLVNTDNLGPARAFNRGISEALTNSDLILIMNSDIKVLPGTIYAMMDYLAKNPDVDGVSGPLLNEDGTRQMIKTHIWNLRKPNWDEIFRVEFVGTTFAMIRAAAYRRVGGYDENYYFYNEDLDWAERAKRAHCLFMYLPYAPVIHYQSKGKNQNLSRITRELFWSNIYYFKKFYPALAPVVYWSMRADLYLRAQKLRLQLRKTQDTEVKKKITDSLRNYDDARRRLIEEFKSERHPKIPFWTKKSAVRVKNEMRENDE